MNLFARMGIAWIVVGLPTLSDQARAEGLTMQQYRQQVREYSPNLAAKVSQSEAAQISEEGVDYQNAASLSLGVTELRSKQPGDFTMPSYDRIDVQTYSASVAKQFSTGTRAKLSFDIQNTQFDNVALAQNAPPQDLKIATAAPTIELSQPVWQNAFGRGYRLQKRAASAQSQASKAELSAARRAVDFDADATFNRYLFAKERVAIAQRTLDTAQKILSFVKTRYEQNLYEKTDFLQAQALVGSRQLELQNATNNLRSAAIAFNSLRGKSDEDVTDTVEGSLQTKKREFSKLTVDSRPEVSAMNAQVEAMKVAAELEYDKSRPILDVFGSYGLRGQPSWIPTV